MKILCLGNNTELTDTQTKERALNSSTDFHGLISDIDARVDLTKTPLNGYYHTSILDFSKERLKQLINLFDKIIVLAQEVDLWNHPNELFETINLANTHHNVEFESDTYKIVEYWYNLINKNNSFCIFPFIEYVVIQGSTTVCCRSEIPVASIDCNFIADKNYNSIRNKMLNNVRVKNCSYCYKLEDSGIVSPRITESAEWANRLQLTNVTDLKTIKNPVYYEIRASNKCNLQCRMCDPESSHLIENEYNELGITNAKTRTFVDFDVINFTNLQKLYIAGGEPLIDKNFYSFLKRCIKNKVTDFELIVNTNATKLNSTFKKLIKHFNNFQFTMSLDGLERINHYIRWPSVWDEIIDNINYCVNNGYTVTFNVTVSIYNVSLLYDILHFIDTEYNGHHCHIQLASSPNDILSAYNFPDRTVALKNLLKIQTLGLYNVNAETKSLIDNLIAHYSNLNWKNNKNKLQEFFIFNNKLDNHRNIYLKDYIPVLSKFENTV